jgi:PAS domain S-box-containing protein
VSTAILVNLLAFAVSIVLGIVVLRSDLRVRRNLFFATYIFAVAAQSIVQVRLGVATSVADFLRWKHADVFAYVGVASLFQFVLLYVGSRRALSPVLLVTVHGLFAVVIGNVAIVGPYTAHPTADGYVSSWNGAPAVVYYLGFAYTSIVALAGAVLLMRFYLRSSDRRTRVQSGILAFSTMVSAVAGVTFELMQIGGRFHALPLSATSAFCLVSPVLVYAVLRYDLLEITPERVARKALAAMADGVLLTDAQGVVTYANASIEAMLGETSPVGRRLVDLPFNWPAAFPTASATAPDRDIIDHECDVQRPSGDSLSASVSITVLRSPGGWTRGYLVAVRDITERKRAEEMRDGADKMLRHDLRNALTVIVGNAKLVESSFAPGTTNREMVEQIEQQARLMLRQMELYLALLRLEAGTFQPLAKQADLMHAIDEAVRSLRPLAAAHNVDVALETPGGALVPIPRVAGEEALLFGMLSNLLRNAIEASPDGARVTVRTTLQDDIEVSVHNEGAIPPEVRPRFFGKHVTYGKPGGTGLGAYGARRIAEAFGGSIHFLTDDACGTTITVRLPIADPNGD